MSALPTALTTTERRTLLACALIMALRMLGLFMVLPLFAIYAQGLIGATPFLLGLALGIYGLTQALFQVPFGMLSDYFGRKPLITVGLITFALGSVIAASAHTILGMIWGRSLQGSGAIGSTLLALAADTTPNEQRTKAMAIMGITIGASFFLAMFLGPLLNQWFDVPQILNLSALLAMLALPILFFAVPSSKKLVPTGIKSARPSLVRLLRDKTLLPLNIGIFILHALLSMTFIVLPLSLSRHLNITSAQQWHIYLPSLLFSAVLLFPLIGFLEKRKQTSAAFKLAILSLSLTELGLWLNTHSSLATLVFLSLFFTAFNLLEAILPSLVSQLAPVEQKGTAIGIYSCSQFLGIFAGGSLGGWLLGRFALPALWLACSLAAMLWFIMVIQQQRGDNHGQRH